MPGSPRRLTAIVGAAALALGAASSASAAALTAAPAPAPRGATPARDPRAGRGRDTHGPRDPWTTAASTSPSRPTGPSSTSTPTPPAASVSTCGPSTWADRAPSRTAPRTSSGAPRRSGCTRARTARARRRPRGRPPSARSGPTPAPTAPPAPRWRGSRHRTCRSTPPGARASRGSTTSSPPRPRARRPRAPARPPARRQPPRPFASSSSATASTATASPGTASTAATSGPHAFTGMAFDACAAPSVATMQSWLGLPLPCRGHLHRRLDAGLRRRQPLLDVGEPGQLDGLGTHPDLRRATGTLRRPDRPQHHRPDAGGCAGQGRRCRRGRARGLLRSRRRHARLLRHGGVRPHRVRLHGHGPVVPDGMDAGAARPRLHVRRVRQHRLAHGRPVHGDGHDGLHRTRQRVVRQLERAADPVRLDESPRVPGQLLGRRPAAPPVRHRQRDVGRGEDRHRRRLGRRPRHGRAGPDQLRLRHDGPRQPVVRLHRQHVLLEAQPGPGCAGTRVLHVRQRQHGGERRHVVPGPLGRPLRGERLRPGHPRRRQGHVCRHRRPRVRDHRRRPVHGGGHVVPARHLPRPLRDLGAGPRRRQRTQPHDRPGRRRRHAVLPRGHRAVGPDVGVGGP